MLHQQVPMTHYAEFDVSPKHTAAHAGRDFSSEESNSARALPCSELTDIEH